MSMVFGSAPLRVRLVIRFPWWKDLYLCALVVARALGTLEIDPDVATDFIVRHSRIKVVKV